MISRRFIQLCSTIVFSAIASIASAHEFTLGTIQIEHPYARATVPLQTASGAFFGLTNNGKTTDALISVSTPAAKSAEIHTMEMVGDMMKMREIGKIDLIPGKKIAMRPGSGYHIMLIGLTQQLKAGDQFPMTLQFEHAGKIDVMVYVEAPTASMSMP